MIKHIPTLLNQINTEICKLTDIAVIGMSGGADSSLCAIICSLALGKENVYSVHMPANNFDQKSFNKNSQKLAKHLGIHSMLIPINQVLKTLNPLIENALRIPELNQVNNGNSRSRVRMTCLYGICHEISLKTNKRARVVGTGNLSEDFIGYDTKGGDALADFFPIGDLFKSEVYQLLEFFKNQNIIYEELIDRTPSAGLWDGQTDEKELGYTYNQMEESIRKLWKNHNKYELNQMDNFVLNRHLHNKHKHEGSHVLSLRQLCD